MITKKEIDDYYIINHQQLKEYANRLIFKYNRKYKPDVVVSESYLNTLECLDKNKINKKEDIDIIAKQGLFYKVSQ